MILLLFLSVHLKGGNEQITEKIKEAKQLVRSNLEKADSVSKALLKKPTVKQNDTLKAKAYYLRGVVYYYKDQYHLSNYYYRKSLNTRYGNHNRKLRARNLNNMAINYEWQRRYDSAFAAYNQSLAIEKELADTTGIAQTWLNMGLLAIKLNNPDEADSLLNMATGYFQQAKDTLNLAKCYQNLGYSKYEQQKWQQATGYQEQALQLFRQTGYDRGTMHSLGNLGVYYGKIQRFDTALRLLDSLSALGKQYPAPSMNLLEQLYRAHVWVLMGKTDKAAAILDTLKKQKQELIKYNQLQQYYETKLKWASKVDDMAALNQAFKRYQTLKDSLNRNRIKQEIAELKVLHQVDKKNALLDKQEKVIAVKTTKNTWLTIALIIVIGLLLALVIFYQRNKLLRGAVSNLNLTPKPTLHREEARPKHYQIFKEFENLIKEEEWYKNPELSLRTIAGKLGTNENYLSQAINEESGMHFKSYVNNYRVALAKQLLLEQDRDNLFIGEVAEQVGFSNGSTFSRNFKHLTGLTPSEYVQLNRYSSLISS